MSKKHDHENTVILPIRGIDLMVDSSKLDGCAGGGVGREEVQQMIQEALESLAYGYELCEFYYFRHPTPRPGFQPCKGDVIADAATLYPQAWEYLQSADGQLLRKTEAEWQAMSQATWHTNADGTKIGWSGIGGVPFFVQDLVAGTLRLPDLRGMYAEAAGFDSLGVGDVDGDRARNMTGNFRTSTRINQGYAPVGIFTGAATTAPLPIDQGNYGYYDHIFIDSGRQVPIGPRFAPARWGALACVYLGQPAA
ncbi:MAG: hypothetical protein FWG04_05145 [Desulfovibrionaceae bacterium]|nr:hypothetical protein [Desulfovibrionaceae bacterium]